MPSEAARRLPKVLAIVLLATAACSTSEGTTLTVEFVNQDGLTGLTAEVSLEDDDFSFAIPVAGTSRDFDTDVGHEFVIQIFQNVSTTNSRHCTVDQADLDDGSVEFLILSNGEGGLDELSCW
jgi:hypothetical protein